jgi:hypothetical protein
MKFHKSAAAGQKNGQFNQKKTTFFLMKLLAASGRGIKAD